jgi:glucose dehydrogenase
MLIQAGGRQLVIAAGKAGVVVALDRQTGRVVWKQPVGVHNGHDNDGLYAMRHEYARLKLPESVYPGLLGGVISPMATDGSTIFAPVVNLPVNYSSQSENTEGPAEGGELVALDAATGAVRWAHKFSAPVFGAATVVNDLVFATTFGGEVVALNTASGAVEWHTQLPAGTNTGVAVSGDTLIAPAGFPTSGGQQPQLVAYRLGG